MSRRVLTAATSSGGRRRGRWRVRGDNGEFVRYGESEFVIPAGTPIEVLGAVSTAEYCR